MQCIVTARGLVLAGEAYVVMAPKTTPVGVFAAAFSASLQAAFTVTQGALVAKVVLGSSKLQGKVWAPGRS